MCLSCLLTSKLTLFLENECARPSSALTKVYSLKSLIRYWKTFGLNKFCKMLSDSSKKFEHHIIKNTFNLKCFCHIWS
jgi:hypothetical protein